MKRSIWICLFFISVSVLFSNKAVAQKDETNKAVLVINAVVDQEHKQEVQRYLSQMMQIFKDNGGKPLGRYKTIEKINGSQLPEMIAIVSFETADTIKKMLAGDDYTSLSELRERVFSDLKIVVCTELN